MSTLSPLQVGLEEIFSDSCSISAYYMSQMPGGKDVSSGLTLKLERSRAHEGCQAIIGSFYAGSVPNR